MKRGFKYKIMIPIFGGYFLAFVVWVISAIATGTMAFSMVIIGLLSLLVIGSMTSLITAKMVKPLADTTAKINEDSGEISAGSQDLSLCAREQVAIISKTSAAFESFSHDIKVNTENSVEVRRKLDSFTAEMQAKKGLVENVSIVMKEIENSSKEIDNITNIMNDLRFQAHLLSLNATVEAARAGEAGRGFTVIAAEIKNLVQKAAESAKTIQSLVSQNMASAKKGLELVNESSAFFSAVMKMINELTLKIAEIPDSSGKQSTGVEQINQAMMQLEKMIYQNAALVEKISTAAKNLDAETPLLNTLVNRFNL